MGRNRITSGLSLLGLSWGMRVSAPHPGVPRRAQSSAPIATPGPSRPEPASSRALAARTAPLAADLSGVPAGARCHTDKPWGAAVDRVPAAEEGLSGSAPCPPPA